LGDLRTREENIEIDHQGTVSELETRQGTGIFLYSTLSRSAMMPNQPPTQQAQCSFPWDEADHSFPSKDLKNGGAITPLPNTSL
jgi:hypothetical protein